MSSFRTRDTSRQEHLEMEEVQDLRVEVSGDPPALDRSHFSDGESDGDDEKNGRRSIPTQRPVTHILSPSVGIGSGIGHVKVKQQWNEWCSLQSWRQRAFSMFPILTWGPQYPSNWKEQLQGDVVAGLTVGCMLITQAMAYALLAGLPPITGLYAGAIPMLVYACMGSSRVLQMGPVAMDSLLTFTTMSAVLSQSELDNEATVVALAAVIAFIEGLIQMTLGAFKLGVVVNFLSSSVMSGFTLAAAIIIFLSQLKHLFGVQDVPRGSGFGGTFKELVNLVERLDNTNPWTVLLSAVCMGLLYAARIYKKKAAEVAKKRADALRLRAEREKSSSMGTGGDAPVELEEDDDADDSGDEHEKIPMPTRMERAVRLMAELGALMVTVLGIVWCIVYDAVGVSVQSSRDETATGSNFVDVVGDIPPGLKSPAIPDIGQFSDRLGDIMFGAGILAIVGFMEVYAISKIYADNPRYKEHPVDANQELLALASANVAAGIFGAYPVGGSFSRTAVNEDSGAYTLLASIIVAVIIILALVALSPLFFYIPMAALASIVQVSVLNLLHIRDFKLAWKLQRKSDFTVMCITFAFTILLGIQWGIGVGVVVSMLVTVRHSAFPEMHVLGHMPGTRVFMDLKYGNGYRLYNGVVVVRFSSELYFANSDFFRRQLRVLAENENCHTIVLDATMMAPVDLQGVAELGRVVEELKLLQTRIFFVSLRGSVRTLFDKAGLTEKLGRSAFFREVFTAVEVALRLGVPSAALRKAAFRHENHDEKTESSKHILKFDKDIPNAFPLSEDNANHIILNGATVVVGPNEHLVRELHAFASAATDSSGQASN